MVCDLKKFVPEDHGSKHDIRLSMILIAIAIAIILLFLSPSERNELIPYISLFLIACIIYWPMALWRRKCGLTITDKHITYRFFRRLLGHPRKGTLDVQQIAVIRVAQAARNHHTTITKLTGKEGNFLYSMLFLTDDYPWRMHHPEAVDVYWEASFREELIYRCTYDQEVIDYLKTLNPKS